MLRRALLGFLIAALAFVSPPRDRWSGPIRVYNPTPWQQSVRDAVGAWDRSGVHAHFTLVSRREDADVVIVASDHALARACHGIPRCIGYTSQIGFHRNSSGRYRVVEHDDARAHQLHQVFVGRDDRHIATGIDDLARIAGDEIVGLETPPARCRRR